MKTWTADQTRKGEATVDSSRIQRAVADILEAVGEEPGREGLAQTPARVAQMYQGLFAGVGACLEEVIDSVFETDDADPVALSHLPFFSMCEHHLLPFFGEASIGYVPSHRIAGVSKLGRVLEVAAARPQIQERLTAQVAEAIFNVLEPELVIVRLEAEHLCMSMRGIRKPGAKMLTTAVRDAAPHKETKETLLALMNSR